MASISFSSIVHHQNQSREHCSGVSNPAHLLLCAGALPPRFPDEVQGRLALFPNQGRSRPHSPASCGLLQSSRNSSALRCCKGRPGELVEQINLSGPCHENTDWESPQQPARPSQAPQESNRPTVGPVHSTVSCYSPVLVPSPDPGKGLRGEPTGLHGEQTSNYLEAPV